MPNAKHIQLIKKGSKAWNKWRSKNPGVWPDLSGAELSGADLNGTDLSGADLSGADLSGSNLSGVNLNDANLIETNLKAANLTSSDLRVADLTGADLTGADLTASNLGMTNFTAANLQEATLIGSDLAMADLSGAELSGSYICGTQFCEIDLSVVHGLASVIHLGPSTIDVDTLVQSDGEIPDVFLRGIGVPEDFITFLPSLLVGRAIEFYSCFISYSHQDQQFSQRLYSRMQDEKLRVWYAPEDMKGGRKLHEEIFRAIQIHDRLLLVLSESSMKSEWVMTEIRRTLKAEREEKRRKLFPIRLIDFASIREWECFDNESGKDLAVEVREYYIPDFSNWKDNCAFEAEFTKLLRDLKATET